MKKIDPNEKHTFQIHLKQYVPTIYWDPIFEQNIQGCQHTIKYGVIEFNGTESEFNAFMDQFPTDESQFKVIGITNRSDVLIEVKQMNGDDVSIRIFENEFGDGQFRFTTKSVLNEMFMAQDDAERMETNFVRQTSFRTWIRRSDFLSITKMKFHNDNG